MPVGDGEGWGHIASVRRAESRLWLPPHSFFCKEKKKIPVQGVEVSHLRGELLMLPTVLAGRAALPGPPPPGDTVGLCPSLGHCKRDLGKLRQLRHHPALCVITSSFMTSEQVNQRV